LPAPAVPANATEPEAGIVHQPKECQVNTTNKKCRGKGRVTAAAIAAIPLILAAGAIHAQPAAEAAPLGAAPASAKPAATPATAAATPAAPRSAARPVRTSATTPTQALQGLTC